MTEQEIDAAILDAAHGKCRRADSVWFWKEIAAGRLDGRVAIWVQMVAHAMVAVNGTPKEKRPEAALKAAGLAGVGDKHRALRNMLDVLVYVTETRDEMHDVLEKDYPELLKGFEDFRSVADRELRKTRKLKRE